MAAAAAAPRKGVATSGNVCSYRGKSVALDVHFAVWDGDLALLHKLLASQCYGACWVRFPHAASALQRPASCRSRRAST